MNAGKKKQRSQKLANSAGGVNTIRLLEALFIM